MGFIQRCVLACCACGFVTAAGAAALNISAGRLATPVVSSVAPTAIGLGPYTLTVTGDHFESSSAVWVNGSALATQYVSANQLTANGTATAAGTLALEVVNPGKLHSAINTSVVVTGTAPP